MKLKINKKTDNRIEFNLEGIDSCMANALRRIIISEIPIMAVGGVLTTNDAIEKLNAGASLVQIYTGFIYEGPWFTKQINKSILHVSQL